ncbi:MAG: hypothetical protein RLZZ397_45 [Pseudomonadota bacterium]|jgi:DNA-binding transcriptional MerR regulator
MIPIKLPPIPAKRYFTIGEVADLCAVKPHVLRYWEQEFTQLRPVKRAGNRRYYQHHEVLMIRRIRDLLYDQGFTIQGARTRLDELADGDREARRWGVESLNLQQTDLSVLTQDAYPSIDCAELRDELIKVRDLLLVESPRNGI